MKNFPVIKSLIGDTVKEEELKNVECYVNQNIGLFIPSMGKCEYAQRNNHSHPSYMVTILFSTEDWNIKHSMEIKPNNYFAAIMSPDIPHNDIEEAWKHYYCIMINREYFESQYRLYSDKVPNFEWQQFTVCSDILKTLNTFAFECSKNMPNSEITLNAQATIITHWLIRSIIGETLDMRAISSNYGVARAQQYMEQHFAEGITVSELAELAHRSESSFNRIFKKEMNQTPIQYLNEIRIEKAKVMLRRKDISMTEISARCGFGSSAHFATCFKSVTKVTPSEYRDSYITG